MQKTQITLTANQRLVDFVLEKPLRIVRMTTAFPIREKFWLTYSIHPA